MAIWLIALAVAASANEALAEAHKPLVRGAVPASASVMLGAPQDSDIAAAIENEILSGGLEKMLQKNSYGGPVAPGARAAMRQAYAQAIFSPLWTREAATALMSVNPRCREHGFDTGISDEAFADLVARRFSGSAENRAQADLQLTAVWVQLASMMSGGLSDEGGMIRSVDNRPTRSDLVSAIRRAASLDPVAEMERFASLSPQYDGLRDQLAKYRRFSDAGGWMKIRKGEMLEPGMDDPRIPALRLRLQAEGFIPPRRYANLAADMAADISETVYDETLAAQVKSFQAAHGLTRDGVIGPSTLAALNESVESKISRIERSMAHWRANPNLGDQFIWTNIPSYRVEAWKDGVRGPVMKTIVGKSRTPSPAFSDEIEYVVANPKWFLPIGLFKRQKLRKLRQDPSYAARYNYEIYDRASGAKVSAHDIDWTQPGVARQIQMVQTPGPHNALGQLKIIFPNRHSVYLHGTPDTHLFERDVRALSSGCIRLEDPVAMANWLSDHDSGVETNQFNRTLAAKERQRFYLDQHVNVHLTYLPAVVSPEGRVEFPRDIYRDFKKPTLADGVYDDDIGLDDIAPDRFVENGQRIGPTKAALQ